MSRVEFFVDGALVHTDTNGADGYTFYFDIDALSDGSHALTLIAYDTLGNTTTLNYTINVLLGSPDTAPVILSPTGGTLVNTATIAVSGTAPLSTEVLFFINDVDTGVVASTDETGHFSAHVVLNEGENRIKAAARNRGGTGPLSAEIMVTLDTTLPSPPTNVLAQSRESGPSG